MTLGEATRQYQDVLEALRTHPDSEELRSDLEASQRVMEVLWLRATAER